MNNPKFIYKRIWDIETEPEGKGRGADDTYQERMAELAISNGGCYGNGAGGSGKSKTIEIIVEKLTIAKNYIYGCSFTHIAVANISQCLPEGAHTIQHFLLNKIPRIKRAIAKGHKVAIILDESSMIPMHFWGHLANLKFLNVEFYIFGDYAGQFKPITLTDLKWDTMDTSDFMHDLCNGLKIEFKKYRRGDDFEHFKLVTSIYPTLMDLSDAFRIARTNYIDKYTPVKTTLCVSNAYRKRQNTIYNKMEYTKHPEGVFIPFLGSDSHKGQQMYIWPGLILQSNITEQKAQYNIKNGLFYKIIKVSETVTFKKNRYT